jgi:hypothetical protein
MTRFDAPTLAYNHLRDAVRPQGGNLSLRIATLFGDKSAATPRATAAAWPEPDRPPYAAAE